MKSFTTLARAGLIATAFIGTAAFADPMPATSFLTALDPQQLGRLSRNGVQQDYTGDEAYPGVINPTTLYHFRPYTINVGSTPFVDITFDSISTTTFIAAYLTAYNPTHPEYSWLGDPGTSGNYFSGTDPLYFSFAVPVDSTIVLIVNETTPNAGLGSTNTFNLFAQGSSDSSFTDVHDFAILVGGSVVPEPATLALLAGPLAGLAFMRRRKTARVAA